MKIKTILLIVLVILSLFIIACSSKVNSEESLSQDKIKIVTTIFPLYEFAKKIGGDKVDVTLLLPSGTEPHSYEPKPSDLIKIQEADVFIYVGEMMEPWAHDILAGISNNNLKIIESSSFVTLLNHNEEHEEEHDSGAFDPHIWLDFENDQKIINQINLVLSEMDLENSDYYSSNTQDYSVKLFNLDNDYKESLKDCEKTEFLVAGHNFFRYIDNRYNLTGISAIENLEPNTEPTPRRIQEIVDIAKEHDLNYILTEVLVSKSMADSISKEVGAQILIFNPAGNLPKEEFNKGVSFISIMQDNLISLKTALECK